MKFFINATCSCTCLLLTLFCPLSSRSAGIPVFDAANMQQNIVATMEAVNQTIKQIEEYALQLQQYEDQIKNSLAPAAYVWDQAQRTMNKILALQDQLDFYTKEYGGTDGYLKKFGSVSQYRGSPYFGPGGNKEEQRKDFLEAEDVGSEAQKHANDNVTKTLEQQQKALREDAASLERLQGNAQSSQGRMEALQSANQLATPGKSTVTDPCAHVVTTGGRKRPIPNRCRTGSTTTGYGRKSK